MNDFDRRYLWAGLVIAGLVLMLIGGFVFLDNQRKAQEAEAKVAELTQVCQTAASSYQDNWRQATDLWKQDQQAFSSQRVGFQLGSLKSPRTPSTRLDTICNSNLIGLQSWLADGTDRVKIYDAAVSLIDELNQIVDSATAELQQARDAKGRIEAVEIYAWYTVKDHVFNPPVDAVSPQQAQSEFNEAMTHTTQAWRYMADSDWQLARNEADMAYAWLASAYEHASSPTPTPLPTNTPRPTDTPEPYNPPPQTNFSWSSDDSGSDSGSWDSGGTDSGSWDSGGSDSGSWDSGGSDSGSWDSGGSDSGSWKAAPRLTPQPTRVIK